MEKFQEFVAIAPWTMIFTWVNLLILVLVMKKLLFKPVMEMFAQREKEVGSMYEKAEEAQKNAVSLVGGTHYSTEKYAVMEMVKFFENLGLECEFLPETPNFEEL